MAHPPYSPELAPLDFWLFDHLKGRVGTYPDGASLANAITKVLHKIPVDEYKKKLFRNG